MNMILPIALPEVQSSQDLRNIVIQRVGVKSMICRVHVANREGPQPAVAAIGMYGGVQMKGAHMSRVPRGSWRSQEARTGSESLRETVR